MAITEAVTQETGRAVTAEQIVTAEQAVTAQGPGTAERDTAAGLPDPMSGPQPGPKSGPTPGPKCGPEAGRAEGQADCFRPIPVWFFAFEGVIGASYDIARTASYGWIFLVLAVAVNVVLARTVLRGRLRMAKAILRGKKTRKIAVGLIALRVGVHYALGAIGVEATAPATHLAFAVLMCATTVTLLAVEQRVMLRALNNS
jgi:hypothetical protein